ncbi:hypothetical protein WISP_05716 [Willisornis vidua]|uniref:Uncharacterized protein n=1 Tax=Willisornis vidua TaxID=1566151 RepID=A0ABQ9DXJ9_9PASS|nr:hypothetical protein WISP_05716 [Willisornis vidua]
MIKGMMNLAFGARLEKALVQTVNSSGWKVPEDSVRIDAEIKSQIAIHSSVLPGTVIDYSEDIQEHPSSVIKSVMVEDVPEEGEGGTLSLCVGQVAFCQLNPRHTTKGHFITPGVCSDSDHKATELEKCTTKELPYIPYNLATMHIIKIVKDMQQMKNKHMKIIRKLDNRRKENQEQTITTVKKHYGEKMRCLKSQLEAYQELMNKSNTHWKDTVKSLRERNRQLIQEKEDLLHQMKKQTENWEEEKVRILENLCKNVDYLYTQHTLTLQELHNISLHVERLHDLMNFQIKILQPKSEKTANEEEKTEWSVGKGYLFHGQIILQKIQESLQKRQKEVTELLQCERRFNKTLKPQMTTLVFLKSLVKKVHTIYCDVPGAQQCISQLIKKNEDETAGWKEAFKKAQADILSYEVFYGNEPMDDRRTHIPAKLFRNIGKAKSNLEYVETEKIVFDCIQTGDIPNWIKRDCLYVAWKGEKSSCQYIEA